MSVGINVAVGSTATAGVTNIKLDIDAVRVAFATVISAFFFFFGKFFTSFSIFFIKKA
ncbi:hypothetical protein D3C84_349800 [compost metagenome]